MKIGSFAGATFLACVAMVPSAFAADASLSKDTQVSLNTSFFSKKFEKTGSKFQLTGWIETLSLSHRLNDSWSVGGFVAASQASAKVDLDAGEKNLRGWTPGAYAVWNNGGGLFLDGALSYGMNAMDSTRLNTGRSVGYQSHTRQLTTALGATQFFPIMPKLLANVGARYTRLFSTEREYIDPIGGRVPSQTENWGMGTVRGGLAYLLGDLTPFVGADFNRTNREVVAGSGSRNFLGYEAGTRYRLTPNTGLNATFAGTTGIRYLTDRRYSVGISHKF